nr:hypothetical protein [Archangium sp.]
MNSAAVAKRAEAKPVPAAAAADGDKIFINQPGGYTGDTWHLAAAMALNEKVHVVLTVTEDEKDKKESPKIAKYYNDLGFGARLEINKVTLNPLKAGATSVGKLEAAQHQQEAKTSVKSAYSVYHSTDIIMAALEAKGHQVVVAELRSKLCVGYTETADVVPKVEAFLNSVWKHACAATGTTSPRILFVNGRFEPYNPQHSLNQERFEQIKAAAANVKGTYVYLLANKAKLPEVKALQAGGPQPEAKTQKKAKINKEEADQNAWLESLARLPEKEIGDIYDIVGSDRRRTATFWKTLATDAHKAQLYFVGGRSGSTDIAAFMGMKTLCWDFFEPEDAEYLRLRITAPALMQVCHIPKATQSHVRKEGVPALLKDQRLESSVEEFLKDTFMTSKICVKRPKKARVSASDDTQARKKVEEIFESISTVKRSERLAALFAEPGAKAT